MMEMDKRRARRDDPPALQTITAPRPLEALIDEMRDRVKGIEAGALKGLMQGSDLVEYARVAKDIIVFEQFPPLEQSDSCAVSLAANLLFHTLRGHRYSAEELSALKRNIAKSADELDGTAVLGEFVEGITRAGQHLEKKRGQANTETQLAAFARILLETLEERELPYKLQMRLALAFHTSCLNVLAREDVDSAILSELVCSTCGTLKAGKASKGGFPCPEAYLALSALQLTKCLAGSRPSGADREKVLLNLDSCATLPEARSPSEPGLHPNSLVWIREAFNLVCPGPPIASQGEGARTRSDPVRFAD